MKKKFGTGSTVTARIVIADPVRFLTELAGLGVVLHQVTRIDELTLELTVDRKGWNQVRERTDKRKGKWTLLKKQGIHWLAAAMLKRPVLLAGVAVVLLLSWLLPSRILVIRVQGNSSVPDNRILEAAENAGVRFWAPRREIRSEKVKNQLLASLPQLKWVGVNTSGSTATITVTERSQQEAVERTKEISSIVAAVDGVVRSVTATDGNTVCSVGQAVKAGETLISAYTDCGLTIRATKAQGEVYAETFRDLEAVIPLAHGKKGAVRSVSRRLSLILGKKRINFYKGSGISGTTCDKMYEQYYVTLPGDFRLPVALVVETWTQYDMDTVAAGSGTLSDTLQSNAEDYLLHRMVAGRILSAQTRVLQEDTVCRVTGRYRCLEMIGRTQAEEITADYGKSD